MAKYIIILKDKKQKTLTSCLLHQHINHLRALTKSKILYLCGPFKDDDQALQIIIANNKEEAEKIANQDPFIKNKYYQSYDIFELIEANEQNNWLCDDTQTKINLRRQ